MVERENSRGWRAWFGREGAAAQIFASILHSIDATEFRMRAIFSGK